MTLAIRAEPLGPDLRQLLIDSHLPTEDLTDPALQFYVSRSAEALLGMVALERYGEVALLRSLAVAEHARRLGIGTALVRYAEQAASSEGARTVYLLTISADQFFAGLGYHKLPRGAAPAVIASTAQFSSLCPSSAAFMSKAL